MEIKIAENIGFCWGVKRAVEITFQALRDSKSKLYSLGRVIHNPQMTAELSELGLVIVKDMSGVKKGRFLVRSHGISPLLLSDLSSRGIEIVDATCPFVKRTQSLIRELRGLGYRIIIAGEKEHPEVKGLVGCADNEAVVINSADDAGISGLDASQKWAVVAQSTQSQKEFQEIVSKLVERNFLELRILFTICQETLKRETSAQDLARTCDLVLIIGGFDSANTRRLKEIAESSGRNSYHIEHADQVECRWFDGIGSAGVISGTSTPRWVVDEVIKRIKEDTSYLLIGGGNK